MATYESDSDVQLVNPITGSPLLLNTCPGTNANDITSPPMGDVLSASSSCEDVPSYPEQYRGPTARQRLGELIRLRPYQTDPYDNACAERIAQLQETIRMEDEDEQARERNQGRNESIPSSHSGSSAHSGITICTDDILPNFRPRETNWIQPVPDEGLEWGRWLNNGIPHVERCIELFRLVLIGDFPLMNRGVPRWLLFILNAEIYFTLHSSIASSPDSRNLMSFREMRDLMWTDHRIGLCQRRENS